jgi:hypothetical protein
LLPPLLLLPSLGAIASPPYVFGQQLLDERKHVGAPCSGERVAGGGQLLRSLPRWQRRQLPAPGTPAPAPPAAPETPAPATS